MPKAMRGLQVGPVRRTTGGADWHHGAKVLTAEFLPVQNPAALVCVVRAAARFAWACDLIGRDIVAYTARYPAPGSSGPPRCGPPGRMQSTITIEMSATAANALKIPLSGTCWSRSTPKP